MAAAAAVAFVRDTVAKSGPGVAVFSKSYCPYCRRTKKALFDLGIRPVVVELDQQNDGGRAVQTALAQITGQRTVPNVWLSGKFVGGNDDTFNGIRAGLFANVDAGQAIEYAEAAGVAATCSEADGLPCLCYA